MRITYNGVILSEGGKGSPAVFATSGERSVGRQTFARAPHARMRDRGNRTNTVSWEHSREFPTIADAQAFMLLHAASIPPGPADLYVFLDDGRKLVLRDAVLETPSGERYQGVRTAHTYTATGGALEGAAVPDSIDPNTGQTVPAALVLHEGVAVTSGGAHVTHS